MTVTSNLVQHARDAIIQADVSRYNGAHRCALWCAFASRGLGMKADNFRDNSDIPSDCPSKPTVPFGTPVPANPPPKTTVPFDTPVPAIPKPTTSQQPLPQTTAAAKPTVICPNWFPYDPFHLSRSFYD